MPAKKVTTISMTITDSERVILDRMRKRYYTLNQSEVLRMLINEGAKTLLAPRSKTTEKTA